MIKQIASSRRRPGMTRREYLDHHFRVHGAIADGAEDRDARPQYAGHIQSRFEA